MAVSVKFGAINGISLVTPCALKRNCANRGLAMDVTLMISKILNWNCTFEPFGSSVYGDIDENGTATGMVGAIKDGLYHTSLPMFTPTYRRYKAIDFAKIFFTFDGALVTRAPKRGDLSEVDWSLLTAFRWSVWLSFAILLLLCSLLITLSTIKYAQSGPLRLFFDWMVRLVKNDCEPVHLRSLHIRMCFGFWILCGLVLTSSYTGMLFSEKVARDINVPYTDFETFVSCLERGRCRLVTHTESINSYQEITSPGTELTNRVWHALETYPSVVMPQERIFDVILNENRYYLVWHWPRQSVYYNTEGNKGCKYYFVDSHFIEHMTFPVRKNSTLLKNSDKMAYIFTENQIHYNMYEEYFRPTDYGDEISGTKNQGGAVRTVLTATYAYTMGCGLGFLALTIELLHQKRFRWRPPRE